MDKFQGLTEILANAEKGEPGTVIEIGDNCKVVYNKNGDPVICGREVVSYPFWREIDSILDRESEEPGNSEDCGKP